LRRPRLADNRTSTAFRDQRSRAHVRNARSLARRAQYFPSSASFRINLSRVRSDTAFFSRRFSRSSSFRRCARSTFGPPPPVVALLRDPKTTADLAGLLALVHPSLGFPQHPDRLLGRVVLLFKAPLKAQISRYSNSQPAFSFRGAGQALITAGGRGAPECRMRAWIGRNTGRTSPTT
jgi:hypothetical protein